MGMATSLSTSLACQLSMVGRCPATAATGYRVSGLSLERDLEIVVFVRCMRIEISLGPKVKTLS